MASYISPLRSRLLMQYILFKIVILFGLAIKLNTKANRLVGNDYSKLWKRVNQLPSAAE